MNWEEAKDLKIGDLVKYRNEHWGEELIYVVSAHKSSKSQNFDWIETKLVAIIEDPYGEEASGRYNVIFKINSRYWEQIA